jgi:hypothetical protein
MILHLVRCLDCQWKGRVESKTEKCPKCGSKYRLEWKNKRLKQTEVHE